MATIKMFGTDGSEKGAVEVKDEALVLDRGEQAVRDAVVARAAGCRAGTASSLAKGEVNGSNKKPWKQKGTGRARAGLKQSP
ncbi:MAG: 50S ribosomal protein L4, partial [Kiritimatiellae bacterium]|nr:50S ribosomal protein L4 [Kiritimatiellia bacterium]